MNQKQFIYCYSGIIWIYKHFGIFWNLIALLWLRGDVFQMGVSNAFSRWKLFIDFESKNKQSSQPKKEMKLALLFCYQSQTDTDLREEHLYITLPSMYQSCIFISHSWLYVTLQLQPIYFTLGALRGSFQGPIKLCAAKQMWNIIFMETVVVLSHLFFSSASISLCWISISHLKPFPVLLLIFISDSETTEDETTEPQMETKEGPGRHQDKAGRRGPSGISSKI